MVSAGDSRGPSPGMDPEEHTQEVVALGPFRHACHGSGACCTGWRVQLTSDREAARVMAQAAALGIADPIVDGAIRREGGRCVFLSEDRRCAIHARFGKDQKPGTCQHFPRRSCHAEDGIRVATDPSCASGWRSFADGPQLDPWVVLPKRVQRLEPIWHRSEVALIRMAREPDMTVLTMIGRLIHAESELDAPPPPFVARLLGHIARVTPYLVELGLGPILLEMLEPSTRVLARFLVPASEDGTLRLPDPSVVPPWPGLPPDSDAYALDVISRYLFLRVGDAALPPIAHTLLVLGAALACAYAGPQAPSFGPGLASWTRVLRQDKLWVAVVPDVATIDMILGCDSRLGPATS